MASYVQGGDPLDFRPGNTTSLSLQSTSLTDQHPEQFVIRYSFKLCHLKEYKMTIYPCSSFYKAEHDKRKWTPPV